MGNGDENGEEAKMKKELEENEKGERREESEEKENGDNGDIQEDGDIQGDIQTDDKAGDDDDSRECGENDLEQEENDSRETVQKDQETVQKGQETVQSDQEISDKIENGGVSGSEAAPAAVALKLNEVKEMSSAFEKAAVAKKEDVKKGPADGNEGSKFKIVKTKVS